VSLQDFKDEITSTSTGNPGLDALADAIAERLLLRMEQLNPKARLLDVSGAAQYLGRSRRSIYAMVAHGDLPSVEQGGRIMFDRTDLDQAIEFRKRRR
jgi:excisionase family DNA binding protein